MSWAEVAKLQDSQRDRLFNDMYIIESSQTWTAPHNGYYKIICVGAGGTASHSSGSSSYYATGGGGGVAVKTKRIAKNATLTITIDTSNVTCDGMIANNGGAGSSTGGGAGGTATGGDYNYTGLSGIGNTGNGGSVGCFLTGLMTRDSYINSGTSGNYTQTGNSYNGWGICGHGGGAGIVEAYTVKECEADKACVIIIPLESI